MRLFLGLELPDDIKNLIHGHLMPLYLSPKGWEKPHDYHQTLLFIGDTAEEELESIRQRLTHFTFTPFTLATDQFYFFNRRVMYLGFIFSKSLLELKQQVDLSFTEWVAPHSKPFIPHVTVKRWQRYEYEDLKKGLEREPFCRSHFTVSNISLFKSEKDAVGNKYHVICRGPTKAGP